MTAPPVDVIIATRDRPELLRRAIDAVLGQRYDGPVDVTVVFDQSEPDPSLATTGPGRSVRVTVNARTPGLPGARNTGIAATEHPYVAFCDDDDVWLPGKLAPQVALLEADPATELATTGIVVVSPRSTTPRVIEGGWITQDDLVRSRVLEAHPSTFVARRAALAGVGPVDEEIPGGYAEDYEWLLRFAARHRIAAVPEPLVEVHWHRASFFADRWRTIVAALEYLLAAHPELRGDPAGHARILGQQAFALAAAGDRRAAARAARRAWRVSPTEARSYLAVAVAAGVPSSLVLRILQSAGRSI
jgi:glycosyltransferase involved in cell wall biosynthesis